MPSHIEKNLESLQDLVTEYMDQISALYDLVKAGYLRILQETDPDEIKFLLEPYNHVNLTQYPPDTINEVIKWLKEWAGANLKYQLLLLREIDQYLKRIDSAFEEYLRSAEYRSSTSYIQENIDLCYAFVKISLRSLNFRSAAINSSSDELDMRCDLIMPTINNLKIVLQPFCSDFANTYLHNIDCKVSQNKLMQKVQEEFSNNKFDGVIFTIDKQAIVKYTNSFINAQRMNLEEIQTKLTNQTADVSMLKKNIPSKAVDLNSIFYGILHDKKELESLQKLDSYFKLRIDELLGSINEEIASSSVRIHEFQSIISEFNFYFFMMDRISLCVEQHQKRQVAIEGYKKDVANKVSIGHKPEPTISVVSKCQENVDNAGAKLDNVEDSQAVKPSNSQSRNEDNTILKQNEKFFQEQKTQLQEYKTKLAEDRATREHSKQLIQERRNPQHAHEKSDAITIYINTQQPLRDEEKDFFVAALSTNCKNKYKFEQLQKIIDRMNIKFRAGSSGSHHSISFDNKSASIWKPHGKDSTKLPHNCIYIFVMALVRLGIIEGDTHKLRGNNISVKCFECIDTPDGKKIRPFYENKVSSKPKLRLL